MCFTRLASLLLIALFFGLSCSAQVLIGEVSAFGALPDVLEEEEDWIELWNAGVDPVSLSGLRLSDDPDDWAKWPLPDQVLLPDERIVVFACPLGG